jgi:hypothetical protein
MSLLLRLLAAPQLSSRLLDGSCTPRDPWVLLASLNDARDDVRFVFSGSPLKVMMVNVCGAVEVDSFSLALRTC